MKLSKIHTLTSIEYNKVFDANLKEIFKQWKEHLRPNDKKVLRHFIKYCPVFIYYENFCCWKKIPFKNKKDLSLKLAQFFKIYVALTSLRSTNTDSENFDIVIELPFRLEKITRGEDPYGIMPQVLVRLKHTIDWADPHEILSGYSQSEILLLEGLTEKDIDEAINFLFAYGPAFLSFYLQHAGKNLFDKPVQSFSKGIITALQFYLDEFKISSPLLKGNYHQFIARFCRNYFDNNKADKDVESNRKKHEFKS